MQIGFLNRCTYDTRHKRTIYLIRRDVTDTNSISNLALSTLTLNAFPDAYQQQQASNAIPSLYMRVFLDNLDHEIAFKLLYSASCVITMPAAESCHVSEFAAAQLTVNCGRRSQIRPFGYFPPLIRRYDASAMAFIPSVEPHYQAWQSGRPPHGDLQAKLLFKRSSRTSECVTEESEACAERGVKLGQRAKHETMRYMNEIP
jgi:hypothetical protein